MSHFTIGQLAKKAGVNLETVRYYERRGLLPEPPRSPAGYRLYSGDWLKRLAFIKRAQSLGFTLEEIGALLSLDPSTDCGRVDRAAQEARHRINQKIDELSRMRDALEILSRACHTHEKLAACPLLESLQHGIPEM